MAMTNAERARKYRASKGAKPRGPLKPCGTNAAYHRHLRKGETPCAACAAFKAAYQRERRAARKASK